MDKKGVLHLNGFSMAKGKTNKNKIIGGKHA
jgi:hypothetical protein